MRAAQTKATVEVAAVEAATEHLEEAVAAPAASRVPEALKEGRYRILKVLGEGAFGRTYLAEDLEGFNPQPQETGSPLGRTYMTEETLPGAPAPPKVAIKELQPGRMKTWKDYELFEREASTLRGLRHKGVPRYVDHFELSEAEQAPRFYLVQEFIEGKTLEDELAARTVLDEESVRKLAEEVLEILVYLHRLNPPVIHRDIKPSNLIRRASGEVVLIDFGSVREVLDASSSEAGSTLVGTFGYMPPEQYAGQAWPQTDLFALGATCAHLLTGQAPERLFQELFHIELPEDVKLSLGFRQWLRRLLEPDLERRFRTAGEALEELRQGFLMRTYGVAQAGVKLAPWPGRAPRPLPGFHLRDPIRGNSYMFMIWLAIFATFVTLALPVTAFVVSQPVWALLGIPVVLGAIAIAVGRVRASQDALQLYPVAEYTVGEVTRAYLGSEDTASAMSLRVRLLDFRYYVNGRYHRGHLLTHHKELCQLRSGDPIAVLYDPAKPEQYMVYVG